MRDLITAYTFDKAAGTVTFTDIGTVVKEKILGIWNAQTGTKLYDPHLPGFGGTVATNVLTLAVDTSAMNNSDTLTIFYEGLESNALAQQATLAGVLSALGQVATNTNLINLLIGLGNPGDVVANTDTGLHNLIALTKRLAVHLSTLIANQSTDASQLAGNAILSNLLTELGQKLEPADLAALATSAKQDTSNTALADILAELRDDVFVSQMIWENPTTQIFYREERVRSQNDGSITTVYTRLSDQVVVVSLPAGVVPVETSDVRTVEYTRWRVINNGTGYSTNDWLLQTTIVDTTGSGSIVGTFWYNVNTSSSIAAPLSADIVSPDTEALNDIEAHTQDTVTLLGNLITDTVAVLNAIGPVTDTAPLTDTASAALNGRLQRIAQRLTTLMGLLPTALGAGGGLKVDGSGTPLPVSLSTVPLPTGAATAARQDTGNTSLGSIDTKLPAALVGGKLSVTDPTALPLPAGAATSVKQDTIITALSDLLAELRDDVFVSQMIWENPSTQIFYREERIRSQNDGTLSTVYTRLSDQVVVGSLPAGVVPVETSDVRSIQHVRWRASAGGTGFSINDWIIETVIIDTTGTGSLVGTFWYNLTTSASIAAPLSSSIVSPDTDALNNLVARTPAALGSTGGLKVEVMNSAVIAVSINETQREDDKANSATKGFPALIMRKDSPVNMSDTDEDFEFPQMSGGAIWVRQSVAIPAGTNLIGKFGIDQTTPGTTNHVAIIPGQNGVASNAGTNSALVQRVTIATDDGLHTKLGEVQTTPTANTVLGRLKDLMTGIVLAAGTATIGKIYAAFQSTKALTNANVSVSSSGENTIVAAVAAQTTRVFRGSFTAASAVTLTFKSSAGGTTLATIPLAAGATFAFDCADGGEPLWVTTTNGAFILSLSGAVSVTGFVQYITA